MISGIQDDGKSPDDKQRFTIGRRILTIEDT